MSNLKIIDKKIDELWHSGLIDNKNHIFLKISRLQKIYQKDIFIVLKNN